jgi:hypothetical protein
VLSCHTPTVLACAAAEAPIEAGHSFLPVTRRGGRFRGGGHRLTHRKERWTLDPRRGWFVVAKPNHFAAINTRAVDSVQDSRLPGPESCSERRNLCGI